MFDFLEQPVPHWLNWLAAGATLSAILVPAGIWGWRRFAADLIAQRSQEAAHKRANQLIEQYRERWQLRQNFDALIGQQAWATHRLAVGLLGMVTSLPMMVATVIGIIFAERFEPRLLLQLYLLLLPAALLYVGGFVRFSEGQKAARDVAVCRD